MAGNSALQEKLRAGIEAARKGNKTEAQKLLRQVVDRDPNNEVAWMWLASALDNLQERRGALEQALRINPNNTRAQEALRQLAAILPPQRGRKSPVTLPPAPGRSGGTNTAYIVIGVVVAVVLIAAFIFSSVVTNQPTVPNEATLAAQQAALLNSPTPVPTIDPDTYTATPFFGVFVTPNPENLPTFPPTFTPTFTPTATASPIPTLTPLPLSTFGLLYTALNPGEVQSRLFQAAGDLSTEQGVASTGDGFRDVTFDPTGRNIAFVRTATFTKDGAEVTTPELFVAPANNVDAARQLTQLGGGTLANPTFAPDGIQIVFSSNAGGTEQLWYITEDGNNLRPLTSGEWTDREPAWSPSSDLILFTSNRAGTPEDTSLTELFTVTVDGADIVQVTDADRSSYSPAWSPDGSQIVFASDRSGDGDIYIMDADGGRLLLLTGDDAGAEDRQPTFAPDGKSVIFLSNRGGDTFQFYQVSLDGRTVTPLNVLVREVQSFAFRPVAATLP